jgi:ATP-binding cassette subfamily B protein
MTLGSLLSFYAALALLRSRLNAVFSSVPRIIEGSESLNRLYRLLKLKSSRPYFGTARISLRGEIALEAVSFRYGDHPVLYRASLTIPPATMVALVGINGSGKSTVVNLILGFYRPYEGHLYADGRPYDELDMRVLRRQIGVVTQDPIIFPGTIWENIVYGHERIDKAQVVQASRLATAYEFIERLPDGYDTQVGEDGLLLSGGERQRILIARAVVNSCNVLIADEPFSNIDKTSKGFLKDFLFEHDG